MIVFLALFAIGGIVDIGQTARFQAIQREKIVDAVSARRALLEAELNARLHLATGLMAFVQTRPASVAAEFDTFAQAMMLRRTGIRSLQLAPDMVVTHVYPLAGNEEAVGHNLIADPARAEAVRRAIEDNTMIVAGPYTLKQGGTGIIARTPIWVADGTSGDQRVWGLAVVLLDLPDLLERSGFMDGENAPVRFALRGKDGLGANGDVFHGPPQIFEADPVVFDVSLPNGSWQLAGIPKDGWRDGWPFRTPYYFILAVLAGSVGYLTWYVLSQSVRLRQVNTKLADSEVRLTDTVRELSLSNAELERFAYVASHDLREPLRMISGFLGLLEKQYTDKIGDEGKEYIAFAKDGAQRMDHMNQSLLTYSRAGTQKLDLVRQDAGAIVAEALTNLDAAIKEAGADVSVGTTMPTISVDRDHMVRVFQNLISNALKYRDPSRRVRVSITAEDTGEGAAFIISDNGLGIPADQIDGIFGIFQRLDRDHDTDGVGIGLAVVRKVVERHGGYIAVSSEEGKGTTFRIVLPLAR